MTFSKSFILEKLAELEKYYDELIEFLNLTDYILGRSKVLDEDFSRKIAPVTGLRNRIVHRYESLDKELFLEYLRKNHFDFKEYIKQVFDYLKKS